MFLPVQGGNDLVQGEAGLPSSVLVPDGLGFMMMLGINHNGFGLEEDVVHCNGDGQQPSQDGQHLVGYDALPAVGFPLREGVRYR